jgi:hypothetical protein
MAVAVLALVSLIFPLKANAASSGHLTNDNKSVVVLAAAGCNSGQTFFGLPVWYKYLVVNPEPGNTAVGCDFSDIFESNGQFSFDNIILVGLAILDMLLILAGVVAVVFVIFGGIQYMLSQGEPERTKGAQSTILNALIGLVIAITASALVNFIGNSFGH